jgi:hypothetical protein
MPKSQLADYKRFTPMELVISVMILTLSENLTHFELRRENLLTRILVDYSLRVVYNLSNGFH